MNNAWLKIGGVESLHITSLMLEKITKSLGKDFIILGYNFLNE